MDVTIHLKRLPGDEADTPINVPHLPCSRWGLPSSISHLMDWCAFTAPFHLYNALRRCSLLSVALSIASPLLGVTQHPALWSPDFPHPDGKVTLGTRPSTQLKPFYYTLSNDLMATKSEWQFINVNGREFISFPTRFLECFQIAVQRIQCLLLVVCEFHCEITSLK